MGTPASYEAPLTRHKGQAPPNLAVTEGLEPSTSAFAGLRSIQLSYATILVGSLGIEPSLRRFTDGT